MNVDERHHASSRARKAWPALGFIAACILVSLVLLGPRLISGGWHLLHGSQTRYSGLTITVPGRWFVVRDGNGITLVSASPAFSIRAWHIEAISFRRRPQMSQRDTFNRYRHWTDGGVEALEKRGFHVIGTREIRVANGEGFCVESSSRAGVRIFAVACYIPELDLEASFNGDAEYAPIFYKVLTAVHQ